MEIYPDRRETLRDSKGNEVYVQIGNKFYVLGLAVSINNPSELTRLLKERTIRLLKDED